jgi:hypothetical protein
MKPRARTSKGSPTGMSKRSSAGTSNASPARPAALAREGARGAAEERRASPRVRPERSARLVDISAGGVCVETAAPLEPDGIYDLILRLDDRRITVACRVVRLERLHDLRRASMAFDRVLESDRAFITESLVRETAERLTVIIR